jgi:hypothetical protein
VHFTWAGDEVVRLRRSGSFFALQNSEVSKVMNARHRRDQGHKIGAMRLPAKIPSLAVETSV